MKSWFSGEVGDHVPTRVLLMCPNSSQQGNNTHKKLQSPLLVISHPPQTPFPSLHAILGIDVSGPAQFSTPVATFSFPRRTKVETPQVNGLKSSSEVSSGIRPVKTRPIAINVAACVQIMIAFTPSLSACSIILCSA